MLPYSGKFSRDKIFANSFILRISQRKFSRMAPFANFVSRRCHAILWCEGIESSVLLVAKMAVNEDVYVIQSKIRGYHVYKNVWEAFIGERLSCNKEVNNVHDPYCSTDESKTVFTSLFAATID